MSPGPRRPGRDSAAMVVVSIAAMAAAVWQFGGTWSLPAYLYLGLITGPLTVIDLREKRLPNRLTLPSYPIVAVLIALAALIEGTWPAAGRAALGALVLLAVYATLHAVHPAGLGMGDVKLAAPLGALLAWQSWSALLWGTFTAFLLTAIVGLALIAQHRASRKSALPFGPFMLLGAWVVLLLG